ncbi:S8 family serine peptidase [Dokdonella sp.]|uniref:S8 family serine peptidase n=1 Tax=Dokdonella sp. TaxID=2291710 RepID=UPI001B1031A0|nr:S8 family serine peptidase [Dokdonella sp.]MBO9664579.1 S8 family serine peptidase [Dokdonella sp.]
MFVRPTRTALASALVLALSAPAPGASAATPTVTAAPLQIDALDSARADSRRLILQVGAFDPVTQQLDASAVGAADASQPTSYAIVQLDPARIKDARRELRARGVKLLGYVPNNAYYAHLDAVTLEQVRAIPGVRWTGPVQPAMKLDPQLWRARRAATTALQEDGSREIVLYAFDGVSSAQMAATLRKRVPGATITARSEPDRATPYVRVRADAAQLDALVREASAIEGVRYVTPWVQTILHNSGSVGAIQANSTATCAGSGAVCGPSPLWDHGLVGNGQIVAVADSGTTPDAAWFATLDKGSGPHTEVTFADDPPPVPPAIGRLYPENKIIAYWTQPDNVAYDYYSGHGTHTTGTVLGDAAGTFGASSYMPSTPLLPNHDLADGMAPNAQLLMQDIGGTDRRNVNAGDVEAMLEQAHAGGARLHNNSWGAPTAGAYVADDAAVDRATRRFEDLLVIVSAGNDDAGRTQTGSPSNAKNAISVAALEHAGSTQHAGYSNLGPAADGRIKPDITAPGSNIISARNTTASSPVSATVRAPVSRPDSGTSMSAPTITGNATLVRQFFTDGFYPRGERSAADRLNPTGAMMKAVLLNGTNPLASPGWPTDENGWGRAWLDSNLWFKNTMAGGDDSRRLRLFERVNAAGLETGDVNEYVVDNVAAGLELRATLAWFDIAAAPGAASALINDLDLEVVAPDGTTYLGNHFEAGVSTAGGSANAKDTVEQVRLPTPVAGRYTIRVKASNVPGDGSNGSERQGYALALSAAFGMPDPTPFPAPTALTEASNGLGGIGIGFTAAAGAQSFQLYRADGDCTGASAADFHMVASGATAPLTDDRTQGGYSYAYRVRGVRGDVEGELSSSCVTVVSRDACTLVPSFDTQSLVADGANASCSIALSWGAASSLCPAAPAITYTIVRDTDPYFGAPTTLADNLTSPAYTDSTVGNGTPYFYRVFGKDAAGNTSEVSTVVGTTPTGADGPDPAAYLDDVDTHTYATLESPWRVTNTAASAGSLSYHNAPDGSTYPASTCASLETPALRLAAGASLNYKAQYNLEHEWDGVVTEISTDDGATWTDLPPTGGYPSTFAQTQGENQTDTPANACGYVYTHGAFNGVSTAANPADPDNANATPAFLSFGSDLAAYAGQTVRIRWRFSSDPASDFSGFWLDEVRIGDGSTAGDVIFANGFEQGGGSDYMCH